MGTVDRVGFKVITSGGRIQKEKDSESPTERWGSPPGFERNLYKCGWSNYNLF